MLDISLTGTIQSTSPRISSSCGMTAAPANRMSWSPEAFHLGTSSPIGKQCLYLSCAPLPSLSFTTERFSTWTASVRLLPPTDSVRTTPLRKTFPITNLHQTLHTHTSLATLSHRPSSFPFSLVGHRSEINSQVVRPKASLKCQYLGPHNICSCELRERRSLLLLPLCPQLQLIAHKGCWFPSSACF